MSVSSETKKLLALSQLKGIGDKTLSQLHLLPFFREMDIEEIVSKSLNKAHVYSQDELKAASYFAELQADISTQRNGGVVSIFDKDYPKSLKASKTPPPYIFFEGNISLLNENTVAVIGTREPTAHGVEICQNLTEWLVSQKWHILSGLAIGIDSISHMACLKAKGKTAAVLAHGLDSIYPKSNTSLARNILEERGVLVSEYPYGFTVNRITLVKRDAIQAALSSAVFLVQTDIKGGSLHASREIIRLKRPLVIVGQSKTDIINVAEKARGNISFINDDFNEIKKMLRDVPYDKNLIIKLHNRNYYEQVNDEIKRFSFLDTDDVELDKGFDF